MLEAMSALTLDAPILRCASKPLGMLSISDVEPDGLCCIAKKCRFYQHKFDVPPYV